MINIKVKTNGDLYRVILKTNVPWMGDYYGEALIVSHSK